MFLKEKVSAVPSRTRSLSLRLLSAALLTSPMGGSTLGPASAHLTSLQIEQQNREVSVPCGTTEVQQPLPDAEATLLRQMYSGEATILDAPAIAEDPHLSDAAVINTLVEARPGETERARNELVISITRRLANLALPPTPENIAAARQEIYSKRDEYRDFPIFSGEVIFASGAVTVDTDEPGSVYVPRGMPERLENIPGVEEVHYYHGLLRERQGCDWASEESLEAAREGALQAIATIPTRITTMFRMHGNQEFLEFGTLFPTPDREEMMTYRLHAGRLAEAYADRYQNRVRLNVSDERREALLFDNCKIYEFVLRAFTEELRRIEAERDIEVPRPVLIIAGEDDQLAFRGKLMERVLMENPERTPTLSRLYPDGDQLGSDRNNSNAVVLVPDNHGGYIQIA